MPCLNRAEAVLNVVTGVFVDTALQSSQNEAEALLEQQRETEMNAEVGNSGTSSLVGLVQRLTLCQKANRFKLR